MSAESLLSNLDKLPFIIVKDRAATEVSQLFFNFTQFTCDELLNHYVEDIFNTLRVGPNVNVNSIDENTDYFLFTKSHQVKQVNIKVIDNVQEKVFIFIEKLDFNLDIKFPFVSKLCSDNYHGIAIFSLPDITLLKANETFISFFDKPFNQKENCIGKTVSEFVTGFKGSTSEKIWQDIINTGQTYNTDEYMFDRLDRGVTYWKSTMTPIYESGKLKYCIEMTTDITEQVLQRKKLEEQSRIINQQNQQLKNKKDELEEIIQNIDDAIYIYDGSKNFYLVNNAAKEYFKNVQLRRFEDTRTGSDFKYYDENHKELPVEDLIVSRVFRGEVVTNYKMTLRNEYETRYVSVNGRPIYDKEGNIKFAVICSRDTTSITQGEKALKEAQEKLLVSELEKNKTLEQALETKDEFLSLLSHEFRTPLNVINTAIQAIDYFCINELPDRAKKYLEMIKQNTFRQLRLVNNLLDITRANAGRIKINKKNLDIVFLTRAITESVQVYASQKGIKLDFISRLQKRVIGIDDEKYERILLNLLSNALKFTPEGKCITVKLTAKRNSVCIEVKDEGIGIPKDKMDIIFERFGQVDSLLSRQAEGTGIGLSLVKKLTEALGGSISVKSTIGKGSTFILLLPNETIDEKNNVNEMTDLMDNRLVKVTDVEFSDIYL